MAAAEDWAEARGLGRLTLQTGAANKGALGFYRALGYADEEVRLSRAIG
jgi:GNAT superfamily N-acetyltransferase